MDWIGYKIYTEPTVEPVTASDMKEYLRIASSETGHDTLLSGLITAARLHLERVTGRIFCTTVIDVQYMSFADEEFKLPVTPVQSITSITYKVAGVSATLAASQYELKDYGVFPRIVPAYDVSWPDCDEESVVVRVSAGVAASPGLYDKMGIALLKAIVADMYEHPEQQSEISLTENKAIERLFNSYITR